MIAYGAKVSGVFSFRLDLAIAHYRHTLAELLAGLQRNLEEIEDRQPPPAPTPSPAGTRTRQASGRQASGRRGVGAAGGGPGLVAAIHANGLRV